MLNRYYIIAILLIASFSFGYSQTSDHLTFKGIPIDGKLEDYVSQMKQNGFKYLGTEEGTALFKGEFAGHSNCSVGVSSIKQKNLVYRIAVMLPESDTWSLLFYNYSNLKESLTKKYGNPTIVTEKFDSQDETKDDNSKIYEAQMGRCKYLCIWKTDKGKIHLTISTNSNSKCYIFLGYSDKINNDIAESNAKDDL